jgi:hypothetical protein
MNPSNPRRIASGSSSSVHREHHGKIPELPDAAMLDARAGSLIGRKSTDDSSLQSLLGLLIDLSIQAAVLFLEMLSEV